MITDEHIAFIKNHLPKYLSREQTESLFSSLKTDFPYSNNPDKIYVELVDKSIFYQGDGIIEIPFSTINLENQSFDCIYRKGAVLSNTCDIDPTNERNYLPFALFGSIYELAPFLKYMNENKIKPERINNFENDLRKNQISTLFYLPEIIREDETYFPESFIRFDETTSLPVNFINNNNYNKEYLHKDGDRIYTLSNYGFYLFIFKLSVHFCRFREGVFRVA